MFTHLHLHTEYSLLDGAAKIEPVVKRAADLGMDALAITDHGVMYGAVDFYLAAKKHGIKPILGCEVYTAPRTRFDKVRALDSNYGHLVLLAKNNVGYQNLMALCSLAFVEGYYYKPRVDLELLRAHADGVIALSACLKGDVNTALLAGDAKRAKEIAETYRDIYGENYYLEIQNHGLSEELAILPKIVALSKELSIPLVATNDVHYVEQEDAKVQDVLMCIQTGKKVQDENRMRFSSDQFYLKSEQEMRALFPNLNDALANTQAISSQCNVKMEFDHIYLPKFPVKAGTTAATRLRELCDLGVLQKYGEWNDEIKTRLDYELSTIETMGFADYFLIVWDYVNFARKNGISVGPGRGSAAGSLVAYVLNITDVDPLRYGLIFERFLNPERVSMPDIDIDFCYIRRQEVIDYVVNTYGSDRVAQIVAFDTMAARAAIRDVGRALGVSYALTDRVAKQIPKTLGITLKEAMEQSETLRTLYDTDAEVKRMVDMAFAIEGMPRNITTHAAGVIISDAPLYRYVPVLKSDESLLTQYPMNILEKLGLVKMDFLGLRNLTIIHDTVALVAENTGVSLDMDKIDGADKKVYEMIAAGDTDGVFQLESDGMKRFLRDLKPTCFEDIIAGLSLFRPATAKIQIPLFLKNRADQSHITYKHPLLEEILKPTYGSIVYQEQAMQIFRSLAGYSLGRADLVRRAMAKKKHDVLENEKHTFLYGQTDDAGNVVIPGALARGVPKDVAEQIFLELAEFSKYAFNKSHATAYAKIAYQTAYLKVYYPVEFLVSLLKTSYKQADYIESFAKYKIRMLPPSVNKSGADFTAEGKHVRFGLGSIKNVGIALPQKIEEERRQNGPFQSFSDFLDRMWEHLNKRTLEPLIKCGVFDELCPNRRALFLSYEDLMDRSVRAGRERLSGQLNLFDLAGDEEVPEERLTDTADFSKTEKLLFEKELAGIYFSGHPLEDHRVKCAAFSTANLGQLLEGTPKEGTAVRLCVLVRKSTVKRTANGAQMAVAEIEDLHGTAQAVAFPSVYERAPGLFSPMTPVCIDAVVSYDYNDNLNVTVRNIASLLDMPIPNGAKLYLKVPDRSWISRVLAVIDAHKGNHLVVLYLEDCRQALQAEQSHCVTLTNELVRACGELLGFDAVKIK